jgi:hypothetical protein
VACETETHDRVQSQLRTTAWCLRLLLLRVGDRGREKRREVGQRLGRLLVERALVPDGCSGRVGEARRGRFGWIGISRREAADWCFTCRSKSRLRQQDQWYKHSSTASGSCSLCKWRWANGANVAQPGNGLKVFGICNLGAKGCQCCQRGQRSKRAEAVPGVALQWRRRRRYGGSAARRCTAGRRGAPGDARANKNTIAGEGMTWPSRFRTIVRRPIEMPLYPEGGVRLMRRWMVGSSLGRPARRPSPLSTLEPGRHPRASPAPSIKLSAFFMCTMRTAMPCVLFLSMCSLPRVE